MRHEAEFRIDAVALLRIGGVSGGTRVLTPEGAAAVEGLRRGDRVLTREGVRRVIGAEARSARMAAVRISAQALGLGMPGRDLLVGPATRLWLPRQSRPVEALRLVDGTYVTEEPPRAMTLWTLVFAGPQVVRIEGVEICV